MTDSEKLIKLAEWFDLKQPGEGNEVQQDLRRIANELPVLRKRCEDLEALNYEFQDTLKSILDTSEMVPSIKEEAEKLLNGNQIKS